MKHEKFSRGQSPKAAKASPPAAAGLNQNEIDFSPAPDEAAKKFPFSHVNQGSSQGHEARHWLEAEAQLRAERKPANGQGRI